MEAKTAIRMRDISFAYDGSEEWALSGASFEVVEGGITCVLGPNGCGKSTALKVIAGILKPSDGEVAIEGMELSSFSGKEMAKTVAAVHQKNYAPPDLTVRKLIAIGRTPYHTFFGSNDKKSDHRAVEEAMRMTDTARFADTPVSALSGGEMQRAWLAMALAQETKILLLDEITTYLDVHYQIGMMRLIKELNRTQNKTILMVLHDVNLALQFSDYCILMKDGGVFLQGETQQVLQANTIAAVFDIPAQIIRFENRRYCVF